ncbi:MAG TPA: glycyl-radical enzyme activating protein [Clostridiales bacterium]|jgi:glycyl-radical enzyme activating protein|nr:glycyl-radical enzyme activating protein [Clostridiales bacterium]
MKTGTIFELTRFATHDGTGLRSTLFLKGCPLNCPWCQNPEGISPKPLLWHNPKVCLKCGCCVAVCPAGALTLTNRIHVNHEACTCCRKCVDACPAAAMYITGQTVTAQEAADMLLRDQVFFGPDGGVTLSGGEVLCQWEFAREVLDLCKQAGADTAIETCLLAPQSVIEVMLPVVDHFLVDIKFMDPTLHRSCLGADNHQILKNHQFLLSQGADVLVRTPLVPGYTATEDNIRAIARYLHQTDPNAKYELLNFNPLCRSKYDALEQEYPVQGGAFSAAEMDSFYDILVQEGISQIIKE